MSKDPDEAGIVENVLTVVGGIFFLMLVIAYGSVVLNDDGQRVNDERPEVMSEEDIYLTQMAEEDEYYARQSEIDYHIQQAQEDDEAAYDAWTREQAGLSGDSPSSIDCDDFATQYEAQEFFEQSGGINDDPYVLDMDNDGIACELNP